MTILAIETSCDETAVAVVKFQGSGHRILANIVSSQVKIHAKYGGVVPSLASREHLKNIIPCLEKALRKAKVSPKKIELIGVTTGPGLIPALLIGTNTAKALSFAWDKPIIGINHIEAHIYANWLKPISVSSKFKVFTRLNFPKENLGGQGSKLLFPALCLVVSGGHTQLILMKGHGKYRLLGETRDDAVGEAFDKVAKLLNLGYPGGPSVAKMATKIKNQKFHPAQRGKKIKNIELPRPMIHSKDFDFSFSGLKTAVLYLVKDFGNRDLKVATPSICASFQQAVVDVLIAKTIRAAKEYRVKTVMLAGGVAANLELRKQFKGQTQGLPLQFLVPPKIFCTDNAVMVAVCAYYQVQREKPKTWRDIKADANLRIV